jgi:hypothetical protein
LSSNTNKAQEALTNALLEFSDGPERFLADKSDQISLDAVPGAAQPARK